jgi:hypothetical protein
LAPSTGSNITPDKTTGIGNYSLHDFDRAVRHGIAPSGKTLYPAMPYPSYAKVTDDDMRALYAYFMHGVQPAKPTIAAMTSPGRCRSTGRWRSGARPMRRRWSRWC